MAVNRFLLLFLVGFVIGEANGGLVGQAIGKIGKDLIEGFKKLGLSALQGQYKDPTKDVKFGKWQAPKGQVGGYTCKSKLCLEGGGKNGEGKKWDKVCQINPNSYHYCVPFVISPELTELQEVYRAMRWYRENTCVAFVEYQQQSEDYVKFNKGQGCSSDTLGKKGGEQEVELGPGCYEYPAITFHEMMHVLGFEHLHQNPNREQYIDINYNNIDKKFLSQFEKRGVDANTNLTFNYDSVLLYGSEDFQKSDVKGCQDRSCWTIIGKNGQQIPSLYTKSGPTQSDIQAINALYDCSAEGFYNPDQLKSQRTAPLEWQQEQQMERASGMPEQQPQPGQPAQPGPGSQGAPANGMQQGGGMGQQQPGGMMGGGQQMHFSPNDGSDDGDDEQNSPPGVAGGMNGMQPGYGGFGGGNNAFGNGWYPPMQQQSPWYGGAGGYWPPRYGFGMNPYSALYSYGRQPMYYGGFYG